MQICALAEMNEVSHTPNVVVEKANASNLGNAPARRW